MINVVPSFVLVLGTVFRLFGDYFALTEPYYPPKTNETERETFAGAQISPDGNWLSFAAPYNGVDNVWIRQLNTTEKLEFPVTFTTSGIGEYSWALDSEHLTTIMDNNGDENWHLFKINIVTRKTDPIFEAKGAQILITCTSQARKSELLVSNNLRDKRYHDVFLVNIATGAKTLVYENTGEFYGPSFFCDKMLNLRLAYRADPDGGRTYYKRNLSTLKWESFRRLDPDEIDTRPIRIDQTGRKVYWADNSGKRDKMALILTDLEDWQKGVEVVHENVNADVMFVDTNSWLGTSYTYFRPFDHLPYYVVEDYLKQIKYNIDPSIIPHFRYLNTQFPTPDEFTIDQTTLDGSKWIIIYSTDIIPPGVYLYTLETKSLIFLEGNDATIPPPLGFQSRYSRNYPVEILTRDGLTQVCYLTIPWKSDPKGTGRPNYLLSLVIEVHGGPWTRDSWGFNGGAQDYATKGIAYISCNFRGSVGYGKAFLAAGNGQWGAAMQNDLTDAVNWAIRRRIANPKRIVITGASYGGYAALAGLTFTPTLYSCALDEFGPSNMGELLKNGPPYWASLMSRLMHRMLNGTDPNSPEGIAFLASRSPINFVDRIVRPLMIVAGANDIRVPKNESDEIAKAMSKRNVPLLYVEFPDEGHGVSKGGNGDALGTVVNIFMAKCLGIPVPKVDLSVFNDSSIQFMYGKNIIFPS